MPFCLQDVSSGRGFFNNAFDSDARSYFSAAGITPASATPTAYDQAATFNGTNQYLSNASFTQNSSFTIAFWVYPSNSSYNGIVRKSSAGTEYASTDWQIFTIGSNVYFQGQAGQSVSINTAIALNSWNYVVATYDSSTLIKTIQVNTGTPVSNTGIGTMPALNTNLILSWDYAGVGLLLGSVAGMGYWNAVLTSNQITDLYNGGIGRSANYILYNSYSGTLVSYWALNETSGASVYVDSNEINNLTPYGTPTNSVGPIATATASSQSLINTFVKGIKGLGLWNNFVCWPLRSSQNASATLTAYSLGGLGAYNGTLVNNPSWTSTGIQKTTGSYQYISIPNVDIASVGQFSLASSFNVSAYGNAVQIEPISINTPSVTGNTQVANAVLSIYTDSSSTNLIAGSQNMTGGNGGRYMGVNLTPAAFISSNFHWMACSIGPASSFNGVFDLDGNYNTSVNGTGTAFSNGSTPVSGIGFAQAGSTGYASNISLSTLLTTALSQTQLGQLYSLYKSTLGVGLNLQP